MLRWLKWWALWLLAGELIYMFRKDDKFRTTVSDAQWVDKLKEIGKWLVDFNKWVWNDLKHATANLSENETVINFKEKFSGEYDMIAKEIDKLSEKASEYKNNPEVQKVIESTETKLEEWKKIAIAKYEELNKEHHFDEKIDVLISKLEKVKENLNKEDKTV